jgi:hypothetical protein
MRARCVVSNLGQMVCGSLISFMLYRDTCCTEEKELPDEKLMSVPLVLDDCEPANTLMTLMESKKFMQRVGQSKSERSGQIPTHPSPSESSDLDENPHSRPRRPHPAHAPRTATTDAPDINKNQHRRHVPPYVALGSCTAAEASDPEETPRARARPHRAQSQVPHATESWDEDAHPTVVNDRGRVSNATTHRHESLQSLRRHPDTAQYDEQRSRDVPLATHHHQGYHEESYRNKRYTSLQAPVQAHHQRRAADADLNIRSRAGTGVHMRNINYHEYDNEPIGDGHYLP